MACSLFSLGFQSNDLILPYVWEHVFDVAFPASSAVYAPCELDVFEFHFFYDDFSYGFCLFRLDWQFKDWPLFFV